VSIVTESFTSYPWLPAVMAALAAEAPHVDLRIVLSATREPIAALLRGVVDLAFVSSPVRDRALIATPMFSDEWTVVLAPDHRLAHRTWIGAAEMSSPLHARASWSVGGRRGRRGGRRCEQVAGGRVCAGFRSRGDGARGEPGR
jgi:DNA-binding transcriptional LysR family regulator